MTSDSSIPLIQSNNQQARNLPIHEALKGGVLDTSSGQKMILIGGELHSLREIITRINNLYRGDPDMDSIHAAYLTAAREYARIIGDEPVQKNLCQRILSVFSCCRCSSDCQETEILFDAKLTEEQLRGRSNERALDGAGGDGLDVTMA